MASDPWHGMAWHGMAWQVWHMAERNNGGDGARGRLMDEQGQHMAWTGEGHHTFTVADWGRAGAAGVAPEGKPVSPRASVRQTDRQTD